MPNKKKPYKKNYYNKPKQHNTVETNSVVDSTTPKNEFNSYSTQQLYNYFFGTNILKKYSPQQIETMVSDPMSYSKELREISETLYNSNGTFTHTVDYMTAMPTLDKVIVTKGKDKNKKRINKELVESTLKMIRDREFVRDALWTGMVDGLAFYYFETTKMPNRNEKYLNDFDVTQIVEVNELGINASVISLPVDYTKIVWRKNNHFQIAFNLEYFRLDSNEPTEKKLKKFPKEIRDAYHERYEKNGGFKNGSWVILDDKKTIVHKIRSKWSEPFGRPIVLAAISNILYSDYFTATKRGVLDEINNKVVYQTFPEGKEKGTSALNKTQQEHQHRTVKNAIMNKQNKSATTFISVAAGTKLSTLDTSDITIFDSKNEENLSNNISLDMGIAGALLNGVGSGSYAAQQQNLELITGLVFEWVEQITNELNKVISANIIKDDKNPTEVKYLRMTCVNKKETITNMKDLYLQGKGSLVAWASACGLPEDVFVALLDHEKEEGFEEKYPPHKTSFTLSKEDTSNKGGRPQTNNPTENTIKSRGNNGNAMPSPSD